MRAVVRPLHSLGKSPLKIQDGTDQENTVGLQAVRSLLKDGGHYFRMEPVCIAVFGCSFLGTESELWFCQASVTTQAEGHSRMPELSDYRAGEK